MSADDWHGDVTAVLVDDRETNGQRHSQSQLFAYCAGSGVLGTAAATAVSLTASGITRIAVWATALGLVSLLAGLAYDSAPLNALWSTGRLLRRQRDDARTAASVR
jgi:hypothetical protein